MPTLKYYDATLGQYVPLVGGPSGGGSGATNLDGLTDVIITAPANSHILTYQGGTWINSIPPVTGATNLDGLTDVAISSPSDAQVLTYQSGQWVNAAASGGLTQAAADARYVNIDGDSMTSTLAVTQLEKSAGSVPTLVGTSFSPGNGDIYNTATSRAITVPAGTMAGDMILLANTKFGNAGPGGPITDLTVSNGFTKLPFDSTIGSSSGGTGNTAGVYWYRIADATCLGGTSLTFTSSGISLMAMIVVRGASSVAHAVGTGLSGASTPTNTSSTGLRMLISTYVGTALNPSSPQNATITSGEAQTTICDPVNSGIYTGNIAIGTRILQPGTSVPATTWTQPFGHVLHVMTLAAGGSPLIVDSLANGVSFGGAVSASAVPSTGVHLVNKTYTDARTPKITVAAVASPPSSPALNDVWIQKP